MHIGSSNDGGKNEDGKEGRELVLCGESEEDLRAMVRSFVGV